MWPLLQVINFKFVPLQYQVLYLSCGLFFWNIFLSHMANRKEKKEKQWCVCWLYSVCFVCLSSIHSRMLRGAKMCSIHSEMFRDVQRRSEMFRDVQRRSKTFRDAQRRSEMSKKQNTSPKTAWSSGRSSSSPPSPPHSSVSRTASPHSPLLAPYTSFTGCMPTTPICRRSHRSSHSQDAQPQERQLLW